MAARWIAGLLGAPEQRTALRPDASGGAWSHRQVGTHVWVYDVRYQRRVDMIVLTEPANSIATTQDTKPLLFAVTTHSGLLQAYITGWRIKSGIHSR